jgi:hypothetical protein
MEGFAAFSALRTLPNIVIRSGSFPVVSAKLPARFWGGGGGG